MSVEIRKCTHIKVNGTRCGSPALKTSTRCYFHDLATRRIRTGVFQKPALLPILEDANAIQIALTDVINDLRQDLIDQKVAGKLLYALQIASLNLKQMKLDREDSVQDLPADWQPMEPKGLPRWNVNVHGTEKREGPPSKPEVGFNGDVQKKDNLEGAPSKPSFGLGGVVDFAVAFRISPSVPHVSVVNRRMGFDKLDPERAAELERIYRTYGTDIKACVEEHELLPDVGTNIPAHKKRARLLK